MTETDEDLLETLLTGCLESAPTRWARAVEEACAAHPELAPALRRRWALLEEAGLVEARDGAGEAFGDFRLLGKLGGGAMGVVHAAWWLPEARVVALKLLRPGRLADEETRRRFRREMEATLDLRHPALVEVHAVGEHDGTPYLAMRLVEGETLADRIARADGVPARAADVRLTALRFAALARGLHLAHEAGLVHRDVKPANVMITRAGDAILLDFGLAHRGDADASRWTDPAARIGTPAYMSPETIEGAAPDRRADVYALGATLVEALTGTRPFAAPTLEATLRRATSEPPPDPRRLNRAVGRDLSLVVRTALARNPSERYATARDLADDLEAVARGTPVRVRRPGLWRSTWRWARDAPRGTRLAGLALVIAGLLAWQWRGVARELELLRGFTAAETSREALHVARDAWSENPGVESWSRLQETLARSHASRSVPFDEEVWAEAYDADGALLVGVGLELQVLAEPFDASPRPWGRAPWSPTVRAELRWDGRRALVLERGERRRLGLVEERGSRTLAEGVLAAELTPLGPRWVAIGEGGALFLCGLDEADAPVTTELGTPDSGPSARAWRGAALAPLAGRVLAWDDQGELRAWDAAGLPLGPAVRPGGAPPVGAACSADGRLFITGSERRVRTARDIAELWSLDEAGARRVARLDDVSPVAWARLTDDGAHVLALHENGWLRAWNSRGRTVWTHGVGPGDNLHLAGPYVTVALARGPLRLLSLQGDVVAELAGGRRALRVLASPANPDEVVVVDVAGRLTAWRVNPSSGHRFSPRRGGLVGAWPVEGGVLTLTEGGLLTRFDLDGARRSEWTLAAPDGPIRGAAFSEERGLLVYGLHTGELHEFDLVTGRGGARHKLGEGVVPSWELALGPAGRLAACDSAGRVWIEGEASLGCPGRPQSLARAGARLAAGGRGADGRSGWIRVWEQGALRAAVDDLGGPVSTLALSSDGELLAAGWGEPRVLLGRLDGAGGGGLASVRELPLHDAVYCAAIAPGDGMLAVGCGDGQVEIWELTPDVARPIGTLRGHTAAVREVVFSPDGRYLVTASWDGTARRWPVAESELARLVDEQLGSR